MTHSRRRKDGKKLRKKVLRQMKALLKRIEEHAARHRDKLASDYAHTKWSKKQAQNIMDRINEKLVLLPKVIKQAHERIIGGRQLKAQDKILSAHEREIDIIVRGKAGKETELAYYHSSETLERRPHPSYFANLVRGHWAGCEIRNHWVRDSIMQEDRTRIRDYDINANLATLRCCLLAIKSRCLTHLSWPQISETAQYDHAFPYQLVANYRVK